MERQNVTEGFSLAYAARPSWSPFIIFFMIGGLITLTLLPLIANSSALPLLLLVWAPIGVFLLWLGSYKIVLLPGKLHYNMLFSRKEMFFADITRVAVKVVHGRGAGYILQVYGNSSDKPLAINVRPFRMRDISIVVDAIATYVPSATLDAIAREMRAGTFRG